MVIEIITILFFLVLLILSAVALGSLNGMSDTVKQDKKWTNARNSTVGVLVMSIVTLILTVIKFYFF
jgi:ABC-type phosphate transport system permease subunit